VSNAVIDIAELYKSYGNLGVLRGVNLQIHAGEAYGLLGPNGAGKSTLLHLLLGFLKPNSGRIRIFGSDNLERTRIRIGYIPERQRYHTRYSAREYLRFIGRFSGMPHQVLNQRVDQELEIVGLKDAADRTLRTFSKGMLQRMGVAQALLSDPELLLIDEPTSGLDPAGQREVLDLLATVRARGHTVFLCTHYLHEVETLCDRVGVLANGRIAVETNTYGLREPGVSVRILVRRIDLETRRKLEAIDPAVRTDPTSVRIDPNNLTLQARVLRMLLDESITIIALEPLKRPIEELYLQAVVGDPPVPLAQTQTAGMIIPPNPAIMPPTNLPITTPAVRRTGESETLLKELLQKNRDPHTRENPSSE
jgi:ABC-2 type transport system ATP-binding protein